MADDHPPTEPDAANRSWRIWAIVTVVALAALAAILGFVVVPAGSGGMAEAIGEAAEPDTEWQATIEGITPPTEVAWTLATVNALDDADADAGATQAEQLCASCHGPDGVAASPAFPSLAGQPAAATYKQLRDFATGHRVSPVMAGMAQGLEDRQMMELAQFYASRERPDFEPGTTGDPGDIDVLVLRGDPARGLPSCESCHAQQGPRGTPVLKGLPATYVATQLRAFADGSRGNDIYGLMRSVSGLLTDEEIDQLAAYYGI